MSNEEILSKILENITQMQENQKKTDERLVKMDNRLDEHYNMIYQLVINQEKMQKDITSIQRELAVTQADIKSIKLETENVISPSIRTLCSMQNDNSERLRKLEAGYQEIQDDLAISEVICNLKQNKMI